jgi:hypothetical protein
VATNAAEKGGRTMTAEKGKKQVVCSKRDSSGKCVELNVNEWDAEHIPGGYVGG